MLILKCNTITDDGQCTNPAKWKMGTWQFCEEHGQQYLYPPNVAKFFGYRSQFGTVWDIALEGTDQDYLKGLQKQSDNWVLEVEDEGTV